MNRHEFFAEGIKRGLYNEISWNLCTFSITNPLATPKPWHATFTPNGVTFIDDDGKVQVISDAKPNEPVMFFLEEFHAKAGLLANLKEDTVTTAGNVMVNGVLLATNLGDKIPYVNGPVDIGKLEKKICTEMIDDVDPGQSEDPKQIYVRERVGFGKSVLYLTELNVLAVQGPTEKVLTPADGMKEFIQEQVKELGDISDPVVLAELYKRIQKYDAANLKGDKGEKFLTKKTRNVVRVKLFATQGAEPGLDGKRKLDVVLNSLEDGWDLAKLNTYINVLRAGSYDRGQETQLGGVVIKDILRATSNVRIVDGDCGTKLGTTIAVTEENYTSLKELNVFTSDGGYKLVSSDEDAKSYIGKVIRHRSMQFCSLLVTDYCTVCAGNRLARNKKSASIGQSSMGGRFLSVFLARMHAKELKTNRLNLKKLIR